jgi:hypothetical protein
MSSFKQFTGASDVQYSILASETLDKDYWLVTKAFTYYVDFDTKKLRVEIPLGFLTDGASVPKIFWNIIPPWGRYGQAAIVHDWLCENLYFLDENDQKVPITRKRCDQTLYEAMQVLGVPPTTAKMIYGAVSAYRMTIGTNKVNVEPGKIEMQEALQRRYAETGIFTA